MRVPENFHLANDWLCFLIGSFLNSTLLWLIAKRTDPEMRPYRPILLFTTLLDLCYLTVYAVVVPVMPLDSGVAIVLSVGPLGWVPQPYNFALVMLWMFFFHLSLWSICVPFIYRYAVVCWEQEYGLREFLAMLAVPVALAFGHVGLHFYVGRPFSEEMQLRGREFFFNDSTRQPPYVVGFFPDNPDRHGLLVFYATFLTIAGYLFVVFSGWRIYRHLAGTATNLGAERALEINKQVSRTLLLQALIPFLVEVAPLFGMGAVGMSGLQLRDYTVYETAIFAWAPAIKPMISMWVLQAYRRQLRAWLTCKKHGVIAATMVTPVNKTNTQHPSHHNHSRQA